MAPRVVTAYVAGMTTEWVVERLGHQGDGIAAGPVFAPRALPGERVTGVLDGKTLRDLRIVTPSDQRIKAPCRHYASCGGCQLQHASDGFVASWKTEVIQTALEAHGLAAPIRPIQTSPAQSRRRATVSARRTKKGALVGFHARASDVIVETKECLLLEPELMAVIPAVEQLAIAGASRKGVLSVTVTVSRSGVDVAADGGKDPDGALQMTLAHLAERFGLARLAWNDEVIASRLPPEQDMGTASVIPPPGAFLQATRHGEAALVEAVLDATQGAKRVADLFCGCGTFALPLARTARVHAVEGQRSMVRALEHGWRHAEGLKQITTEARDLFRHPLMPDELSRFDAVVLDPPRAGAAAQIEQLLQARIPRIAYVSCNPISFAQDAATLAKAGYRIDWVQPVDQFRWSTHVELAASLSLNHMAGDET